MGAVHTVGPNTCLVISGGCAGGQVKKRFIRGGWGWAWHHLNQVQRLPLTVMTVTPKCEDVLTTEGVPLYVTGVAQIKIMHADEFLRQAAEQFLGKTSKEIAATCLHTLEGHLRAILGTLTVEEVYRDRHKFAAVVREVASPDVSKLGIDIVSFTIKEIYDQVTYLKSLGKTQTANVKRDAAVGVAESNRDAGIREAECAREAADRKFEAQKNIADYKRGLDVKQAEFDAEVQTKKADAKLAYPLQASKTTQLLRAEELLVDVIERQKQISVEEKEIIRMEKQLEATVHKPAVAEAYKIEQLAEGARDNGLVDTAIVHLGLVAKGQQRRPRREKLALAMGAAERTKLVGDAVASAIVAKGSAEAEGMRMKANAFKQYKEAAIISMTLQHLPQIAAEVSAPLSRVDKIVMVGDDKTTSEVTKLISQLPPAVEALTGIDLSQVLGQLPGAKKTAA